MIKVLVVLASTREPRTGEKIAKWYMDQISGKYPEMEFESVDLKELNLPWFHLGSPKEKDKKYEDEITQQWSDKVDQADAFVIINPEYNRGYPAPLKNALDTLYSEWNNKPIAFISCGASAGGARAVEQLRLVSIELQMAPIREGIHIINVWNEFNDQGGVKSPDYTKSIDRQIKQLQWWADALKNAREAQN